ncbi:MAG: DUF6477 family protein [Pseudomonadota bacterium]
MNDIFCMLAERRRPRLMMRAARIGAQDYRRKTQLARILGEDSLPRHGAAIIQLMEIENMLEEQRVTDDPSYRLTQHLDVLIALVGEALELRAIGDAHAGGSTRPETWCT